MTILSDAAGTSIPQCQTVEFETVQGSSESRIDDFHKVSVDAQRSPSWPANFSRFQALVAHRLAPWCRGEAGPAASALPAGASRGKSLGLGDDDG